MNVINFLDRLRGHIARRQSIHELMPGMNNDQYHNWRRQHPNVRLPDDYVELLRISNGLKIFREEFNGELIHEGAVQLFPIEEVDWAGSVMYGKADRSVPRNWLALGVDCDGTFFVVLDVDSGRFLQVDPATTEEPEIIAEDVGGLYDWLNTYVDAAGYDLSEIK